MSLGFDGFTRPDQANWGIATDGQSWSELVSTTMVESITGNEGVATGSTAATRMVLGVNTYADIDQTASMSASAIGDAIGIVARASTSGSLVTGYSLRAKGTALNLVRTVAGVETTIATATISFTASSLFWLRLLAAGNLFYGYWWADGTAPPSTPQINGAADTNIPGAGQFGLHIGLAASGDIALFDSLSAQPGVAPPPPVNAPLVADSPYGLTAGVQSNNQSAKFASQLYADALTLGLSWLRGQEPWFAVELQPGVYSIPKVYVDFVRQCNLNGINCLITIKQAPSFWLTQTVGTTTFMDPTATANYAVYLATLFNGVTINPNTGFPYGKIQGMGLNEDFAPGNHDNGAIALANVLNAMVPAVKAVLPDVKIWCAADNQLSIAYAQLWYATIYANTNASVLQQIYAMDFHYYSVAPHENPLDSSGDKPSFQQMAQIMHDAATAAGYFIHKFACTETNFTINTNGGRSANNVVSTGTQWQYLKSELDVGSSGAGLLDYCFFYSLIYKIIGTATVGPGLCDGMSFYQGGTPWLYDPSFASWQAYIAQRPQWLLGPADTAAAKGRDGLASAAGRDGLAAAKGLSGIVAAKEIH